MNVPGAIVSTQKGATSPITQEEIESFGSKEGERAYDQSFSLLTDN